MSDFDFTEWAARQARSMKPCPEHGAEHMRAIHYGNSEMRIYCGECGRHDDV